MQKERLPLWALAWIAAVLGSAVLFLANQDAVDRLLAGSGLEKVLYPRGKNPSPEVVTPAPQATVLLDPAPATAAPLPSSPVGAASFPEDPAATTPSPAAVVDPTPPALAANTYRLFFLKQSPDGRNEPSAFSRELPAGTTPLAATLKALLLGPTLQDKALGALSEIPAGTKLLSLRIKDRTALVSLSGEFEHNSGGAEALAAQLQEVVWTATQFGTVDNVQILIDGQYRDNLGEGGPPIGAPLSRANVP